MIQEYLFTDDIKINDEKELSLCGFVPEIEPIKNSDCKIVKYISAGNSVEDAKSLSSVNETIMDKYKPTVLTNESSAYFNKRLYPLFNEFERKLRKLLYLKSALYKNKDDVKAIDNLEIMEFGSLFNFLFIDSGFVTQIRAYVNGNKKFTFENLNTYASGLTDKPLWEKLFSDDAVPDLEGEYDTVRKHRNDVMHAHNISYEQYYEASKLIQKINNELDLEIGKTIGIKESKQTNSNVDYNKLINESIETNRWHAMQEAIRYYRSQIDDTIPPVLTKSMEQFNELLKASTAPEDMALQKLANSPEAIRLGEYQRELKEQFINAPAFMELKKLAESPVLAELREMEKRIQENIAPSLNIIARAASSITPISGDNNSTTKADDGESNAQFQDTIDKKDAEE